MRTRYRYCKTIDPILKRTHSHKKDTIFTANFPFLWIPGNLCSKKVLLNVEQTFTPIPDFQLCSLLFCCKSLHNPLSVTNKIISSRTAETIIALWATIAAPKLPTAAVREPTLLFVTERGYSCSLKCIEKNPKKGKGKKFYCQKSSPLK